jgi:Carboxypeptidase regulatory-like domain
MKTFTALLFVYCLSGFAQNASLTGMISDKEFGTMPGCLVILKQDSVTVAKVYTYTDGQYYFKGINPGTYSLEVSSPGLRDEIYEVTVQEGNNTADFNYPKACDSKKICPQGNHTNNIIPVVYGLPTDKTLKKAKKGKVYLGGCMPYCEKWHCKVHDLSF